MEFAGYSFAASSRRHRVSRERIRKVVEAAAFALGLPAQPPRWPDPSLLFLGYDGTGELVEIVGIPLDGGRLRVIHAMPARPRYRLLYWEVMTWLEAEDS
ncbi:MAG: hypothetical protein NTZ03_12605 [Actinobacteria bacterium]|nr:hypothetical protein [Actinomycetota bacterium]